MTPTSKVLSLCTEECHLQHLMSKIYFFLLPSTYRTYFKFNSNSSNIYFLQMMQEIIINVIYFTENIKTVTFDLLSIKDSYYIVIDISSPLYSIARIFKRQNSDMLKLFNLNSYLIIEWYIIRNIYC